MLLTKIYVNIKDQEKVMDINKENYTINVFEIDGICKQKTT